MQQAFQNAGASFGQSNLAQKIANAQEQLRDAAEALEQVEPPEDVEEENEEIVEGLRKYADDLDELHEAAERNDLQAIEAFTEGIANNEAIEQIAEAAEEMKHKGYDVGLIGEE